MRSSRTLLITAGLLLVCGLALVVLDTDSDTGYSMVNVGSSAAYSSDLAIGFDGAWLVTTQSLIGYALMWLGTLLVAGVLGLRAAARRSA